MRALDLLHQARRGAAARRNDREDELVRLLAAGVLRGARETLRRDRPLVLFEHQRSTAAHYDTGPDEIHDLLAGEAGMRIFDMDGAGPYTREALREAYLTGRRWNFFARG